MERKNKREKQITWLNKTGNLTLQGRKTIGPNTKFKAYPSEVPDAFRDKIVPLEEVPDEKAGEPPAENQVATPDYEPRYRGGGYYDIVDKNSNKLVNEKGMRKTEAETYIRKLKGEQE